MSGRAQVILVVDDETHQRARMRRLLRKIGYEVIGARDYAEASALYQRRHDEIDMLVIDVSLPGYYGCELAKTALTICPSVKALMISGDTGAKVCKFYGISPSDVHFLKKPFRDSDLVARVRYLLETTELGCGDADGASA